LSFEKAFPPLLSELNKIGFDYDRGNGIDFEPFSEFLSAEENRKWIQAWTGNETLDASEFRIFGKDGTGGYAAFWLTAPDRPLVEQPIVFFGSEGQIGVVAKDFADYLWLLAGGMGPYEAIENSEGSNSPNAKLTKFATQYALSRKKTCADVLTQASAAFPNFESSFRALCK
jgi:hypothetical protein